MGKSAAQNQFYGLKTMKLIQQFGNLENIKWCISKDTNVMLLRLNCLSEVFPDMQPRTISVVHDPSYVLYYCPLYCIKQYVTDNSVCI